MAVRASAVASPTAPKRFEILNFIAFRIISIAVLLRHVFSTWLFDSLWSLNGLELGVSCRLLQCKGPHFLVHWRSSGNGLKKQGLARTAAGTCFHTSWSGARIRVRQGDANREKHSIKNSRPLRSLRGGELRKHGVKLKLVGQPFEVLAMLLECPGQLVTREELRARLWPTDTFVDFDHGLNAAVNKLRDALNDSAEKPNYVETLPRRGYRFISAVGLQDSRNLLGEPRNPKIQSLAVLPLENLSNDPEQEYFADGMTDQLITNLAQISALKIVSRTSAMRYKGTKKSLPEIARELHVD